jgi:phage-related minor tail protein
MANANGNVFIGGNVIPFARGGVVNSPTYFPMSRGNVGLMGEAGPEAIMPLRRGPNGQLGVVARSAPVQVEVVGGDLVLSDDGRIMTQVRVIARQESNAAASRTITTLRTQPKAITGLR